MPLIITIVVLVGLGYTIWGRTNTGTPVPEPVVTDQTITPTPLDASLTTYTNSTLGISFQYPSAWYIRESTDLQYVYFSKEPFPSPISIGTKNFLALIKNQYLDQKGRPVSVQDYVLNSEVIPASAVSDTNGSVTSVQYQNPGNGRDVRYGIFTTTGEFEFVRYPKLPTSPVVTYDPSDDAAIRAILSSFRLTKPGVTMLDANALLAAMTKPVPIASISLLASGVLHAGQTYTITWNSAGYQDFNYIYSTPYGEAATGDYFITKIDGRVNNTGSFPWVVPASLADGKSHTVILLAPGHMGTLNPRAETPSFTVQK